MLIILQDFNNNSQKLLLAAYSTVERCIFVSESVLIASTPGWRIDWPITCHVYNIRMSSRESDVYNWKRSMWCKSEICCAATLNGFIYCLKDKFGNDNYIILNPVAIVVTQRRSAWVEWKCGQLPWYSEGDALHLARTARVIQNAYYIITLVALPVCQ
jgi:hypothetical protein